MLACGDDLQQALALAFVCLLLHLQRRKRAFLVNTVDTAVGPAAFFCLFFFTPGVLLSLSGYAVLRASAWVLSLVAETLFTLLPILIVAWGRLIVATLLASLSFANGAVWVSLSTLEWISIYPALACGILVSASTVAVAHHFIWNPRMWLSALNVAVYLCLWVAGSYPAISKAFWSFWQALL